MKSSAGDLHIESHLQITRVQRRMKNESKAECNEEQDEETIRTQDSTEMRHANAEFEKLQEKKYDTGQTMQVGDCCVSAFRERTGVTFIYLQCL